MDAIVSINPLFIIPQVQSARTRVSAVASNFIEEQLSISIQMGFSIEDDYNVQVTRTAGGSEFRRLVHPNPVRLYKCQYIDTAPQIYAKVISLYHRCFGRFAGFRAKVLDDFSSRSDNIGVPTIGDQHLKYISPTEYQIIKEYGVGSPALSVGYPVRTIFKPVAGSVRIALNGAEMLTGWTIDTTTGIVTFAVAPGGSLTAGFYFDVPVRFDTSIISKQVDGWRDTSEITLVELLNP